MLDNKVFDDSEDVDDADDDDDDDDAKNSDEYWRYCLR